MAATTVLRWFYRRSDPPVVQRVIVEAEEQLALRNQQKLEEAKQALGGRYVLHASNKVSRKREERPRPLAAKPDRLRVSKQKGPIEGNRDQPRDPGQLVTNGGAAETMCEVAAEATGHES